MVLFVCVRYTDGGKFAYTQPILVKVTDPKSKAWTLGLLDHQFDLFAKLGNNIPENSIARASDFAQWVERKTSKPNFHVEKFEVRDLQGFWYDRHSRSLYMSDGILLNSEIFRPDDPKPIDKFQALHKLSNIPQIVRFFVSDSTHEITEDCIQPWNG